ncbi:pyridoxal phosphate-dependent aminotransferase EpsN [Dyadobacter sp. BE34]|uniref:Pyridoxal phosphate-dependent aminotransferase EpsN n=1 Tax=Dyadobacter fermentans TaxID=94254 RepID=A0ABU1R337_9BACT|nr:MULTISPECIES: aminotransferase class I/II-fold pyridoxal phosphate-dependent enzyme [Dyadobacter]MDR6807811.1 pyridoxal phosphate-dependent aminotransferase EpsN [Dyadobacter fermentans]MDR7045552.1 pyridoxal phosphate-dependent aminotransferase EpsN [Dyadobacter sp. BE242]MDR7199865.1 pyridoxal phosphate-dependent aminotransferase EpsN [Dyadobacter sp. BE34]MDR7217676.1 pyridoxal phosphate-dependent aminotransferase EpsN [Dyadobacter sp. BE31]MDR7265756.1 pyridoxal phosphate-dependent amin
MKYKIYLSPPHMSGREMKYIEEAFDSNWIAPVGPNIDAFEEELCQYTGSRHALSVSSGTAALHLALLALGVGPEDIVLCQSLTFVATANPIMYVGATPVFIDSESVTWNMCPNALEDAIRHYLSIGKKPKAVIVVHLYGMPAMLREILYLCKKYEIYLIEDAAEALGSEYQGRKAGTFGDIGILSFNGNKIITTSGGGAMLSDNVKYIERARFLATQAREPVLHYEHQTVGYNYRMSNICAGIGRGQLEVVDERVRQRRANFQFYSGHLDKLQEINFQKEPIGVFSNRWLTALKISKSPTYQKSANNILNELNKNRIESRSIWKPMHLQPLYCEHKYFGNNISKELFEKGICLPSGTTLWEADIDYICNIIASNLR